jgi:hypothetical protein
MHRKILTACGLASKSVLRALSLRDQYILCSQTTRTGLSRFAACSGSHYIFITSAVVLPYIAERLAL